jgi:PleD family two-component response regulator
MRCCGVSGSDRTNIAQLAPGNLLGYIDFASLTRDWRNPIPRSAKVVLLVDDEPKIRRFLCTGFELEGYVVLEAANAADALRIATFNSPDLIVLDLKLPDLPGAEVLRQISPTCANSGGWLRQINALAEKSPLHICRWIEVRR